MQGNKRTIQAGDMVSILMRGENLESEAGKDAVAGELVSFDALGVLLESYSNGMPVLVFIPWHTVYLMTHLVEDAPSTQAPPHA